MPDDAGIRIPATQESSWDGDVVEPLAILAEDEYMIVAGQEEAPVAIDLTRQEVAFLNNDLWMSFAVKAQQTLIR